MNGLWNFPLYDTSQCNQQFNTISNKTSKNWCKNIKPMKPQNPREYLPTFQQDLAIFYHHILFCSTKPTLSQAINDDSLSTWSGLTAKLITKYLPES